MQIRMLFGFKIPCPDPMGLPAGITAVAPASFSPSDFISNPSASAYHAPRTTHDADGNVLGYLHEPQATNLCVNSIDFDSWAIVGAATSLVGAVDPAGGLNAHTLSDADDRTYVTGNHILNTAFGITINTDYVFSVYVKKSAGSSATTATVSFRDNYSGAVPKADFVPTDEWQRIYVTHTTGGSANTLHQVITSDDDIDIWGAQLELGTAATSLIPTYGAEATRQADAVDGDMVIPSGEWTYLMTAIPLQVAVSSAYQLQCAGPGGSPNYNFVRIQSNLIRIAEGTDASSVDVSYSIAAENTAGVSHKIGVSVDADGNHSSSVDGVVVVDNVASTMAEAPQLTKLYFDGGGVGTHIVPQIVQSLRFMKVSKTTAQLQTLTT